MVRRVESWGDWIVFGQTVARLTTTIEDDAKRRMTRQPEQQQKSVVYRVGLL